MHKSGFINIVGRPNAGKSTLMNALVGERMSIITAKPQTTRHRIIGIVSDDDYQLVFSDTPGIIVDPAYRMQEVMNRAVHGTFSDADVMLYLIDATETYTEDEELVGRMRQMQVPVFVVINKVDAAGQDKALELARQFQGWLKPTQIIPISALKGEGTDTLLQLIKDAVPEGPAYYPKDQLTDRTERFFVGEIIREKILELYHQEIPYAAEVDVESFKDDVTRDGKEMVRIGAMIYVERKTQKPILIGKGGAAIKQLGTDARKAIETYLEKKVFLELHVKVREGWRDDEQQLKRFGYDR